MKKFLIFMVGAAVALCSQAGTLDQETRCLAQAVYWEARGEPWQGKVAVAITTLNRVKHPGFPKTICRVVYQPHQYAWTHHRNLKITSKRDWEEAVFVATLTRETLYTLNHNFPALYFHNTTAKPAWRHQHTRLVQIGKHIFYY